MFFNDCNKESQSPEMPKNMCGSCHVFIAAWDPVFVFLYICIPRRVEATDKEILFLAPPSLHRAKKRPQ